MARKIAAVMRLRAVPPQRMLLAVSASKSLLSRLAAVLFAGAPLVVLLLIVSGLYAADQALSRTDRARMESDAAEVANLARSFLDLHVEKVQTFHNVYAPPHRKPDSLHFAFEVGRLGKHGTAFRRLWVANAQGIVVLDSVIRGSPGPSLRGVDIDTMTILGIDSAVARARATRELQMSSAGRGISGDRGFVMVSPVVVDETMMGFVLGTILADSILPRLHTRSADTRNELLITSGTDTITATSRPGKALAFDSSTAMVDAPGNTHWRVRVTHPSAGWPLRVALWAIGITALTTLIVGLIRERRQSQRIADRSQELEHLSTELLHANRAKSEFLANVSHELRTPLNAIVGFVDLLRDGVYGDLAPRQIGPVERIAASATHLRHLVDQVLDLAKITAGRLEVHTDVVDLRSFVLDIAGEMEALVTERGVALSLGIGATLPRVRTDPTHLRQILVNLIGNAIKYTNEGTISVRARLVGADLTALPEDRTNRTTPDGVWLQPLPSPAQGLWIALQVIDTGIGIAEIDFERIFDEFEQVGAGPRGESMQRGTGLGLSISRRLARLLGGDIVVDSELGKGSTFTLWLPVDPADLKLAEERRSPSRPRPAVEA
jgi:signal transduction histidine kinase